MLYVTRSFLSRTVTGVAAFGCAGALMYAILSDNGGKQTDQAYWSEASNRAVRISGQSETLADASIEKRMDRILTGALKPLDQPEKPAVEPTIHEQPSVLSLIRENSDIAPAVSSGTNRVSVTVKQGDTLFGIAKRHGLKLDEIARLNGLSEPYVIKTGQTLYVAR